MYLKVNNSLRNITESGRKAHLPSVVCKDGFRMSVQFSSHNYCEPREDGLKLYSEGEIGFPSEVESILMPWCEDEEDPTGTVYGYVPAHIITEVIEKHGGEVTNVILPLNDEDRKEIIVKELTK